MNLNDLMIDLLDALETKDKQRVLALNETFEEYVIKTTPGYNDYDNFRQSCVLGMINPNMYDICVKDARERFERLKNE